MVQATDPVRELIDTFSRFGDSGERGDTTLARCFGVPAWSQAFYQITSAIVERIDFAQRIAREIDMDEDLQATLCAHLDGLRRVFALDVLVSSWNNSGAGSKLIATHLPPLTALSPLARMRYKLPKPTDEEVKELLGLIEELRTHLIEHQLSDQDFIRQAILDGLDQFEFRLKRIGWFGWGYTGASLRDVLAAYMALKHGLGDNHRSADMEALQKWTWGFLQRAYQIAGVAKNVADRGGFVAGALTGGPIYELGKTAVKLIAGPT